MKLNEKHNSRRKFLKRWKGYFRHEGKLEAQKEYNKKLEIMNNDNELMFKQLENTHKTHIRVLTRKEQEFNDALKDIEVLKNDLKERLANIIEIETAAEHKYREIKAEIYNERNKQLINIENDYAAISNSTASARQITKGV